jgi:purine-nucleoside phosphorylase
LILREPENGRRGDFELNLPFSLVLLRAMHNLFDKIQEACGHIQGKVTGRPEIGIVLGSGLAALTEAMEVEDSLPYTSIPHFPRSTVVGHPGKLILGRLGGKQVVVMAGRFHYYEGYSMEELTFPIRVMRALGAGVLMLSNAAGGMNPAFRVGDMMILEDHINLMPAHPLRGPNDDRLGPRFPDMTEPYSDSLIQLALAQASAEGFRVHRGVYAGVSGPSFETRAEYAYLHRIGADAVGMSTVPEVLVAVHGGMQVFALSVITDLGIREDTTPISHEEVLAAAAEAAPKMTRLFQGMIEKL